MASLLSERHLDTPRARLFLGAVRADVPALAEVPDDRLLAIAYAALALLLSEGLDHGDAILDTAAAHGLDRDTYDHLLGLACDLLVPARRLIAADNLARAFEEDDDASR